MAVFWKSDNLKELNKKKKQEQIQKDEISELQDAIIELADIITKTAETNTQEGDSNG